MEGEGVKRNIGRCVRCELCTSVVEIVYTMDSVRGYVDLLDGYTGVVKTWSSNKQV